MKLKNVTIHHNHHTNAGGYRIKNKLFSKETIDSGEIEEVVGLNSSDNPVRGESGGSSQNDIVEISGLSGTLSDEDYEKVQKDNCIIKAGTQYFYKEFSAATLIVYNAFARIGGQDHVLTESIEITKNTKAYEVKNDNFIKANPTLTGSEDTLTGLKVGNKDYKLSGGTKLYKHYIRLTNNYLTVINTSDINFTVDDFNANASSSKVLSNNIMNVCIGRFNFQGTNTYNPILYISFSAGQGIIIGYIDVNGTKQTLNTYTSLSTFTDTVTEL